MEESLIGEVFGAKIHLQLSFGSLLPFPFPFVFPPRDV